MRVRKMQVQNNRATTERNLNMKISNVGLIKLATDGAVDTIRPLERDRTVPTRVVRGVCRDISRLVHRNMIISSLPISTKVVSICHTRHVPRIAFPLAFRSHLLAREAASRRRFERAPDRLITSFAESSSAQPVAP